MSAAAIFAASAARLAARFGVPVEVRRRHTLRAVASSTPVQALEVATAAAVGATELELELPGGAALSGIVPAGLELTVSLSTYKATSAAAAAANRITVEISPPLAANVSAGQTVGIAAAVEYSIVARHTEVEAMEYPEGSSGRAEVYRVERDMLELELGDVVVVDGVVVGRVNGFDKGTPAVQHAIVGGVS